MTPITTALAKQAITSALEDAGKRFDEQIPALLEKGYTLGATVQFMGTNAQGERHTVQLHCAIESRTAPAHVFREVQITVSARAEVTAVERECSSEQLADLFKRYPKPRYTSIAAPFDLAAAARKEKA